jgi:hypothetical protein
MIERLSRDAGALEPEALAHLASCPNCQASRRAIEQLQATRLEPEDLGGFAMRLRAAHVQREERVRRVAPMRTALLAGSLAAAGALVVGLSLDRALPLLQHSPVMEMAQRQASTDSAEVAEGESLFDLIPADEEVVSALLAYDEHSEAKLLDFEEAAFALD